MHRKICAGVVLALSAGALNGQVPPSVPGGEVHGYVSALFSTSRGTEEIALPDVRVFLRQGSGGTAAPSSITSTDDRGHFRIATQPPGEYLVCAEAPNFQPGCAAKSIAISSYSVYLTPSLRLNPLPGATFGRITLRDGSPAAAQVTVVDAGGKTVAGPRRADLSGYYVLANIPQRSGLKVKVRYEGATATSLLVSGLGRVDLQIPDTAPVIQSLIATVAGKQVMQVRPGTAVRLTLKARDADRDTLHYKWQASDGSLISRDSPSVIWKSPGSQATSEVFVEVRDRKGGAARTSLTLYTSSTPLVLAASVAPANGHLFLAPGIQPAGPPPKHSGTFIDPIEPMGCGDEAHCEVEAAKYYQNIRVRDVNGNSIPAPNLFAAWKTSLGFGADPLDWVDDEVKTVYFNNGDLQLGRDMHCRQIAQPTGAAEIACYVTNFTNTRNAGDNPDPQLSIGLAAQNVVPFATVAMTFTPGSAAPVNFFVFNAGGASVPAATLDSQPAKAVPGVCLACHGGTYNSSTHAVNGSSFLPFDTSSFIFSAQDSAQGVLLSEPTQRDKFRQLNNFVKNTAPSQTIQALIDGWYACGVGTIGCAPDENFVPGGDACPASNAGQFPTCGWSQAAVPSYNFDPKHFYLTIPKTYCRTCHIARPESFNVQNFTDFTSPDSGIQTQVCRAFHMPDAQVPFDGFWSDSQAQDALSGFLAAISPAAAPCLR